MVNENIIGPLKISDIGCAYVRWLPSNVSHTFADIDINKKHQELNIPFLALVNIFCNTWDDDFS